MSPAKWLQNMYLCSSCELISILSRHCDYRYHCWVWFSFIGAAKYKIKQNNWIYQNIMAEPYSVPGTQYSVSRAVFQSIPQCQPLFIYLTFCEFKPFYLYILLIWFDVHDHFPFFFLHVSHLSAPVDSRLFILCAIYLLLRKSQLTRYYWNSTGYAYCTLFVIFVSPQSHVKNKTIRLFFTSVRRHQKPWHWIYILPQRIRTQNSFLLSFFFLHFVLRSVYFIYFAFCMLHSRIRDSFKGNFISSNKCAQILNADNSTINRNTRFI